MTTEEILLGVLVFIIVEVWLFFSNKLGRQLKKIVIIIVDFIAFLMVWVAEIEFYKKMLFIVATVMMCLFWIVWANRRKKDISLQDVKNSRLDDMCFCVGIVFIIVFLFDF